jgi:hypothetical protein
VCHRDSQPRVRFAAAPPPVKNKQHHHSLSCKRSKSDMIFGDNVEWLSWFVTPRSLVRPGGCVPGSRLLALQGPWPKRGSLRRRPSPTVEFVFWCESNGQQLTSRASYQYHPGQV